MGRLTRSGWFSASDSLGKRRSRRNHSTRPEARRLRLEQLEQRTLLAAFSVTNANSGGSGSLHQAVLDANAAPGADSITFAPALAGVTINTVNLLITDDVDIQGPLDGPVILSGPATIFRTFTGAGRILDIAAGANVNISRLTLTNGDVDNREGFNPIGDAFGGAIRNAGTLTVRNSLFYHNAAGEPWDEHGNAVGAGGGGAIYNSGTLTVIDSSFAGNFAEWGSGGAIYNDGTATVTNSTFIDNYIGLLGGAIYNAVGRTMAVTNCTILKSGGDPQPLPGGPPVGQHGIANLGTMALNNTIVADTPVGSDVVNTFIVTGSHNLIKDGSGGVPDTITGDPMLTPPNYISALPISQPLPPLLPRPGLFGPPFTVPPLPGSPAIDAGNNSAVSSFVDQRGAPRINNGVVDIGAVEVGIAPVGIVVTTLTDENNGSIDPGFGAGTSLREALSLKLQEDVTITFEPGLAGTIALDASLSSLVIADFGGSPNGFPSQRGDVTLVGPGADVITIDGLAQTRILEINPSLNYSGLVSISGLTFARGFTNDPDGGGAILVNARLTLTDCVFVNNSSVYHNPLDISSNRGGGAIGAGFISNLSVINCTFTNNSTAAHGGAIFNSGPMTVTDSTFTGNSARFGGAIWVQHFDHPHRPPFIRPTVTSSTFSENSATEYGGAIFLASRRGGGESAELTVINSTISNNSAGLNGGGIYVAGDLALYGSTVYGNSAASAGPEVAGGIAIVDFTIGNGSFAELVTLVNNIVAGSTSGADLTIFLLSNGTVTGSHNLIGDGSGGLPNTISGDPMLGPLADNGGPTQTMALLPGSPAIDAGENNVTPQYPTGLTLTLVSEGSLPGNTHFAYRVSAFNGRGESPAAEASIMSGAADGNLVRLTWDAVPGAWGYNVFGRTEGSEQFLGRVWSNNSQFLEFKDLGNLIPDDAFYIRADIDQRGSGFARVIGNGADLGAFELQTAQLAGDYNRNGEVDAADYVLWRKTLGATGVTPYSGADGDGNGAVGPEDYGVWAANFGKTLESGESGAAAAPAHGESIALAGAGDNRLAAGLSRDDDEGFDSPVAVPLTVEDRSETLHERIWSGIALAPYSSSTTQSGNPCEITRPLYSAPSDRHDDALVAWLAAWDGPSRTNRFPVPMDARQDEEVAETLSVERDALETWRYQQSGGERGQS